jgi:hypothetical protein
MLTAKELSGFKGTATMHRQKQKNTIHEHDAHDQVKGHEKKGNQNVEFPLALKQLACHVRGPAIAAVSTTGRFTGDG